jgi:hypothetical protein
MHAQTIRDIVSVTLGGLGWLYFAILACALWVVCVVVYGIFWPFESHSGRR